MTFWDSSAILPLFVREDSSVTARTWFEQDSSMTIWSLTPVEIRSALARRRREASLPNDQALTLANEIDAFLLSAVVVNAVDEVLETAKRLLFVHPLRAADACQLAAALVVVRHRPRNSNFRTLDRTLADAAKLEGFVVDAAS